MSEDAAINDAIRTTGLAPVDVWLAYFAIGGNLGPETFRRQLAAGQLDCPNRAALIESLNDWFVERGQGRPLQ